MGARAPQPPVPLTSPLSLRDHGCAGGPAAPGRPRARPPASEADAGEGGRGPGPGGPLPAGGGAAGGGLRPGAAGARA